VLSLVGSACQSGSAWPSTPPAATLPADVRGTLTYQRDGNIYVLPLDTKAERKLTDFPMATGAVFSARSPDGARIAYVQIEGNGTTLGLLNPEGTGARKVLDESAGYTTLERPQWAPDGNGIVYTYHGFVVEGGSIKGETYRAERLDPATGERQALAEDAEGPSMAPDGSLAFVRTTRAGQQLVLLDPSGKERVLIAERAFVSLAAPRFSPDGKRIAFTAVGDGPKIGRYGSGDTNATSLLGRIVGGLASAVGPQVAFAHGEPAKIWVADLNGGVQRLGALIEDEPTVAWSEDGQYVAVSGGTGVYVMAVASGQATQLTKVGGFGGIDWTR
jgi:Tol biopolymer transport system component